MSKEIIDRYVNAERELSDAKKGLEKLFNKEISVDEISIHNCSWSYDKENASLEYTEVAGYAWEERTIFPDVYVEKDGYALAIIHIDNCETSYKYALIFDLEKHDLARYKTITETNEDRCQ